MSVDQPVLRRGNQTTALSELCTPTVLRSGVLEIAGHEHVGRGRGYIKSAADLQDVREGRMNVEIGMAVVRPAEFIVLNFSHKKPEA